MANKKDTPNLIFRKEWWDFLRWESDDTIGKAIKLLCEDYFGYAPFAVDQFNATNVPQAHERLAIPMVKSALEEKEGYIQKCDKLSANARQKAANIANESNCKQLQTNESKCKQKQGNTIQYNTIQDNSFFSGAREETSLAEKEKKELLLDLSIYFLSKAVLKPYTTAEAAFNFNESQGWKTVNKNGTTKDYSHNKLAYLKGWQAEGHNYSLDDAAFFLDFARRFDLLIPDVIDNFHGLQVQSAMYFMFDKQSVAVDFNNHFRASQDLIDAACAMIGGKYPSICQFKAITFKKD